MSVYASPAGRRCDRQPVAVAGRGESGERAGNARGCISAGIFRVIPPSQRRCREPACPRTRRVLRTQGDTNPMPLAAPCWPEPFRTGRETQSDDRTVRVPEDGLTRNIPAGRNATPGLPTPRNSFRDSENGSIRALQIFQDSLVYLLGVPIRKKISLFGFSRFSAL